MGNHCIAREDDPDEDHRIYQTCVQLREEVLSRLNNSERLSAECSQYFHEACLRRGAQELTIDQWQTMTSTFIDRVSLDDPRRKERIFRMVEQLCPETELMTEDMFTKCTVAVLTLAERDLRERIMKLQAKYAGEPPAANAARRTTPRLDPVTPLMLESPPPWSDSGLLWPASSSPELQADDLPRGINFDPPPSQTWKSMPDTLRGPDIIAAQHMWPSPESHDLLSSSSTVVDTVHQRLSPASTGVHASKDDLRSQRPSSATLPGSNSSPRRPMMGSPASCSRGSYGEGGMDPMRNSGDFRPPALGGTTSSGGSLRQVAEQQVMSDSYLGDPMAQMKRDILNGNLRVYVFNKNLKQEVKRLALNQVSQRISILRDDGLCDDSWEIDSLKSISQGINAAILDDPPPPERAMAFRFCFPEFEDEDRFLCVIFETAMAAQLASQAFSELCEVPLFHAE